MHFRWSSFAHQKCLAFDKSFNFCRLITHSSVTSNMLSKSLTALKFVNAIWHLRGKWRCFLVNCPLYKWWCCLPLGSQMTSTLVSTIIKNIWPHLKYKLFSISRWIRHQMHFKVINADVLSDPNCVTEVEALEVMFELEAPGGAVAFCPCSIQFIILWEI